MIAQALAQIALWQVLVALVAAALLVGSAILWRDGKRQAERKADRLTHLGFMRREVWDRAWSDYSEHARGRRRDLALTRVARDLAAVPASREVGL